REVDIERQIEANGAASHIGTPARYILIALQGRIEALRGGFAGIDRRVLRQADIDQKLRTIGRRKELAGNERKGEIGQSEESQGEKNSHPFCPHGRGQESVVTKEKFAGSRRLRGAGWGQ